MRCDQCKWWGGVHDEAREWYPVAWKTCNAPRLARGYSFGERDHGDAKAVAENDVGWGIATAPDFGCVLFEADTK